jgi:hypothetical protein
MVSLPLHMVPLPKILRFSSHRSALDLWRVFPFSSAFQPCHLPEARLGFSNYNQHDDSWNRPQCCLCTLGAFLGSKDVFSIPPHEGSFGGCGVLPWLQLLDCILVSIHFLTQLVLDK